MADKPDKWWQTVLWGVALIGLSVFLYWYFWDFERSGDESRRMHVILALLYNVGGKWLAAGVVFVIGLFLTAMGLWDLATPPKSK